MKSIKIVFAYYKKGGCDTGDAKATAGYHLPAKYVIHTVGPMGVNKEKLTSCYRTCLKIMEELKLTSIAFPCISTGNLIMTFDQFDITDRS